MARRRWLAGFFGLGVAAVAVARHLRAAGAGIHVPGGILIGDAGGYDVLMGLAFGGFYDGVAADVAARVPPGSRVLEIGCGPGHLATRMARDHRLDVTGLDLDPAMIERATSSGERRRAAGETAPTFVVGDVAALPVPDRSFDVVVSTLSVHHWDDAAAGIREIARVLKPGGVGLLWDLRPGRFPLHGGIPEPVAVRDGPVRIVRAEPWPWPWHLALTQRIEVAPAGVEAGTA